MKFLLIVIIIFSTYQMGVTQFIGGSSDGHDLYFFDNLAFTLYSGSKEDGFDSHEIKSNFSIYHGDKQDGYSYMKFSNSINIYTGGQKDGYSHSSIFVSFIWTGNIGQGWNVGGNWSTGFPPGINNNVVIPANATNFPAINAGVMCIGQDPSGATYLCKSLLVRNGAQLTLRVNAFLENYGDIKIRGNFYVLNTALNALQNLSGGNITVENSGNLVFQD